MATIGPDELLKPVRNNLRVASDWNCAGISVVGLNNYLADTKRLLADIYAKRTSRGPFVCFMQGAGGIYREGKPPYGDLLAAYIREHSLGEVTETPPVYNPCHSEEGYRNKGYFWAVDQMAFERWFHANTAPNYINDQRTIDAEGPWGTYKPQVNR